ncbi:MAG: hypothetical protein H5T64_12220 [Chloroflexi bacterium]|nr:hypothetical protein [Chloroflexota bacterium]
MPKPDPKPKSSRKPKGKPHCKLCGRPVEFNPLVGFYICDKDGVIGDKDVVWR